MRVRLIKILFTIILFIFWYGFVLVSAVDQKDTAGLTMQIPSLCKLVINDSDQVIDLLQGASGEGAYESGYVDGELNKPSLIVSSNTKWKLSVSVSFDWEIVGTYQKDTSDILLKVTTNAGNQTGFADFTPVSMVEQEIASSSSGKGNAIYNCQYRIKLNWEKDVPGLYIIVLGYTLSTQAI